MVNKIIKTTSTDDMNITDINLIQFAGALLITNKVTPAKPTTNRKPGNTTSMAAETPETNRPTKK